MSDNECPRCGEPCQVEFYGPCDSCRGYLSSGRDADWFTAWDVRRTQELAEGKP